LIPKVRPVGQHRCQAFREHSALEKGTTTKVILKCSGGSIFVESVTEFGKGGLPEGTWWRNKIAGDAHEIPSPPTTERDGGEPANTPTPKPTPRTRQRRTLLKALHILQ